MDAFLRPGLTQKAGSQDSALLEIGWKLAAFVVVVGLWVILAMGHNLWLHFELDEPPFATYFDVQGCRVLTHSHFATKNGCCGFCGWGFWAVRAPFQGWTTAGTRPTACGPWTRAASRGPSSRWWRRAPSGAPGRVASIKFQGFLPPGLWDRSGFLQPLL